MAINYPFGLPLKNNFVEYLYYENLILHHEIDRVSQLWDDGKTIKAELTSEEKYDEDVRQSSVMFIDDAPQHEWLYERLGGAAIQSNQQHWGFDLLGFHQELQLTRYTEGDFFDWHLDFGKGESSARKLSITVQLSEPDDYTGGNLQFMVNHRLVDAPRTKGTAIVFPSFINHRVTPVTGGERQSIVGWVSGPPYR